VGGGIRQRQDVLDLLEAGVHRVVLGTVAIRTPDLVATWAQEFGWHRFVMALDFRLVNESPLLATSGWQQSTELSRWSWLDQMLSRGSFGVLCTDIGKDGMQEGPNFSFYEQITARYPQLEVQASGGVGSVSDLSKLKKGGLQGAIIGKAIYEGKISLAEALQC
jgi:phosphoribosylformimino-5-aminoimidazole carboxamide ribotide isomerase